MKISMTIIVLLILLGCGSDPHHREVMVNKTVKVFSEAYHDQAENYTFKWKPPIGPNNEKIIFDLKNDMLIFTPEKVGYYKVNLSIEDISDQVISKEIFYFKAIPETTEISIIEPQKEKSETQSLNYLHSKMDKTQKPKKDSKENKLPLKPKISSTEYAIQISAWPSLAEARKHQLELIDNGFDAYTQRIYLQKKDEVWHRVRVGNFASRDKALHTKKQIESSTGIATWLDIVSRK